MVAIFFVVGLIIGSFLGAVNYRLKTAEDIVFERSHCPHCRSRIRWYDNVPLLSFVILAGQCRDCKGRISWEYPLVELVTGLLFAATAWKFLGTFGFSASAEKIFGTADVINLAYWLFVVSYLVLIFFHDFDYMLIPDAVVYPAIIVTFIYQAYLYVGSPLSFADFKSPIASALLGAIVAAGFFLVLIWISRGRWIGGGDVKLGFLAGAIVGFPKIIFVLFFTYMVGAVVSLFLIATKRKSWKSQIPFGPFLVTGILLVLFFSEQIQFLANRYLNIGY